MQNPTQTAETVADRLSEVSGLFWKGDTCPTLHTGQNKIDQTPRVKTSLDYVTIVMTGSFDLENQRWRYALYADNHQIPASVERQEGWKDPVDCMKAAIQEMAGALGTIQARIRCDAAKLRIANADLLRHPAIR